MISKSFTAKEFQIRTSVAIYGNNILYTTNAAVWDTGAMQTVVSSRVINKLGLDPINQNSVISNGRRVKARRQYEMMIVLEDGSRINVKVAEEPLSESGDPDILIGMDIIRMGRLSITQNNAGFDFVFSLDD